MHRIITKGNSTLSILNCKYAPMMNSFSCFMIEDIHQDKKVDGQTRIPIGRYRLNKLLPHQSTMAARHHKKWNMPWIPEIENVPGFTHIRMHVGNRAEESLGCPLFNYSSNLQGDATGSRSVVAMREFIRFVDVNNPKEFWLNVQDYDR